MADKLLNLMSRQKFADWYDNLFIPMIQDSLVDKDNVKNELVKLLKTI